MRVSHLLIALLLVAASTRAAPPPNADPQFRDWFSSLRVPGSSFTPCCSVSDCRMVDSRWNGDTQHYEAKVVRDVFSNALRNNIFYENDTEAFNAALRVWIDSWIRTYGDVPETWIEIPEARVNSTYNPTGHAVLCWSTFYSDFNGVFCFIPYQGA
jgi:hypothetical protein